MTIEEKLELLQRSGITVLGDVVLEKHVEHEIGVVQAGGIGIQIVQGNVVGPTPSAAGPKTSAASGPTPSAALPEGQSPASASDSRTPAAASKPKSRSPKPVAAKRELMTFVRKDISDGHLRLLYVLLTKNGWLSGQEPDFLALFSGRESRITLTWLEPYGKGTLRFLFRQMQDEGLIDVPHGFSLDHILEGHFADTQGHLLTGLNSSGEPNAKALPFIHKCIQLLQTGFDDIDREEICEMMGARVVNDENRSRRR